MGTYTVYYVYLFTHKLSLLDSFGSLRLTHHKKRLAGIRQQDEQFSQQCSFALLLRRRADFQGLKDLVRAV